MTIQEIKESNEKAIQETREKVKSLGDAVSSFISDVEKINKRCSNERRN